jgi:hypothetical protein
MPKLTDINLRDPFVLPVAADGKYYLYGTMAARTWRETAVGFDCYTSPDLTNWEGPFPVFRPPANFWADRYFWAPEVHVYQEQYFMFASFKARGVRRGTQILRSDSPLGPFRPLSERPVTPADWECLDGTLFVTPEGDPWMVFCHEWEQVGDGEMCAMPLSKDLSSAAGDPIVLFHASEAPWTRKFSLKGRKGYVTDGPWLLRLPSGELLMLWSSFSERGYAVGVARSETGQLLGPWQQDPQCFYSGDGGHCMTFRDFDGSLWLSLHCPNDPPHERPVFRRLEEAELVRGRA